MIDMNKALLNLAVNTYTAGFEVTPSVEGRMALALDVVFKQICDDFELTLSPSTRRYADGLRSYLGTP